MYNGKTAKLALTKNVICKSCDGIGGKPVSLNDQYVKWFKGVTKILNVWDTTKYL